MSTFWSVWIMFLVVLNLGITLFLFIWAQRVHIPMLTDRTTGHVWAHGAIREGLRKLPAWWAILSAAMFAAGIVYLVLYPGFGASKGVLGWTSHDELRRDEARTYALLAETVDRFQLYSIEALADDPAARRMGARLYGDNCAACHRLDGSGNQALGAPDLTDADWLYGGDGETILASIADGRHGVMPPWESLGAETVHDLAHYVLSLSGAEHDAAAAAAGAASFAGTCVACHGADGSGNQMLGAPDLTDDIWLYGGDFTDVETTIRDGRAGEMPAWSGRLRDDQLRAVAAWVHHLSNGQGSTH